MKTEDCAIAMWSRSQRGVCKEPPDFILDTQEAKVQREAGCGSFIPLTLNGGFEIPMYDYDYDGGETTIS